MISWEKSSSELFSSKSFSPEVFSVKGLTAKALDLLLVELREQRCSEGGFNLTILSRRGSRIASRNLNEELVAVVVESWKRALIRKLDDLSRKLVKISNGRRTKTVIQLKRSWRTAAEKPSLYICMSLMLYRAMMVEVKLVPMLVPMMMGMPCFTESVLEATKVTTREVVAEEDWKRVVRMRKIKNIKMQQKSVSNAQPERGRW